jgi:hypothetical protein
MAQDEDDILKNPEDISPNMKDNSENEEKG